MPQIAFMTWIHNGEKSMRASIESVLNQKNVDLAYYLIDNASTDETWNIMCEYANKDSRVRLIQNDNSLVRLPEYILGITDCTYFANLDADDSYRPDFAARMIAFMEKEKLDIAACGSVIHERNKAITKYRKPEKLFLLSPDEFLDQINELAVFFWTIWAKVFRMDILRQTDFALFIEAARKSVFYCEDTLFCVSVLMQSKRIGLSNQVLHQYEISPTSVTFHYKPERFSILLLMIEGWLAFFNQYGELKTNAVNYIVSHYLVAVRDIFTSLFRSTLNAEEKLSEVKKILEYPLTAAWNGYLEPFKEGFLKHIVDTATIAESNEQAVKLAAECIALLQVEKLLDRK